jgi:hypothetical protein
MKSSLFFKSAAAAILVGFSAVFISCIDDDTALKQHRLFSLSIGRMEDQLDMFQVKNVPFVQKTRLILKDGLFYISNGNSRKVMKFSSYGDLVSMLYNEDTNPVPVLLSRDRDMEKVFNRRAFPYPFYDTGEIAITAKDYLVIEDRVPENRALNDEENRVILDRILLRFDKTGTIIDYLGQEGIGGRPFPFIERLSINKRDELIVISKAVKTWFIYIFNSSGERLAFIRLNENDKLFEDNPDLIPYIDTIFSDNQNKKLYIKTDYYKTKDGAQSEKALAFIKSLLFSYETESNTVEYRIELPALKIEKRGTQSHEVFKSDGIYEFIGIAGSGYSFFITPYDDKTMQLLVLSRNGKTIARTSLELVDRELFYTAFYLDPSGLLSGLLCSEFEAAVVWWRTDRLIR